MARVATSLLLLYLCAPSFALDIYNVSSKGAISNMLTTMALIGESSLGLSGCTNSTDPNETSVKNGVTPQASKAIITLDIECWTFPLDDSSRRDTSRDRLLQVLTWAKEVAPNAKIGFWGVPSNPWHFYRETSPETGYSRSNYEAIWLVELADLVVAQDALFPEFYVYYHERDKWRGTTSYYVSKMRTINPDVEVYPYISQRFWGSIYAPGAPSILGPEVFVCDFQDVLAGIDLYADGAAFWSHSTDTVLNTAEAWYSETQAWIAGSGQHPCPPPGFTLKPKKRR